MPYSREKPYAPTDLVMVRVTSASRDALKHAAIEWHTTIASVVESMIKRTQLDENIARTGDGRTE